MSEHGKFLMARGCQWMLYGGFLGLVLSGPSPVAPFAFAVFALSGLAITFSPLTLTCTGCGASYFDIIPRLNEGMIGQWKKGFSMWKPVPRHCQSCGLDRS